MHELSSLLISQSLFCIQRVHLFSSPVQAHLAHFDETLLPWMTTTHNKKKPPAAKKQLQNTLTVFKTMLNE